MVGDMNCHIGSTCDGFEDVMECFSFGVRTKEGPEKHAGAVSRA